MRTPTKTAHGYGGFAKDMLKKAVVKRSGKATYLGGEVSHSQWVSVCWWEIILTTVICVRILRSSP
jgi:hypothetical protein